MKKICLVKLRQEDLPSKAPSIRFAFKALSSVAWLKAVSAQTQLVIFIDSLGGLDCLWSKTFESLISLRL